MKVYPFRKKEKPLATQMQATPVVTSQYAREIIEEMKKKQTPQAKEFAERTRKFFEQIPRKGGFNMGNTFVKPSKEFLAAFQKAVDRPQERLPEDVIVVDDIPPEIFKKISSESEASKKRRASKRVVKDSSEA